jgi:hypothetical protein
MISFRFHIVSLIAVFLALAIGVVVGSTYVDGAVVDGLRSQISRVSGNLDERQAESEALRGDLGDATDYIAASADFAVTERLTDVPVLLVAVRGIDEGAVQETARLARRAGAVLPGIVWLEPAWAVDGADAQAALAHIVGRSPGVSPELLWRSAWSEVMAELTPAAEDTTTTVSTPAPASEVLTGLQEAGFITVDPLDDDTVRLADLAGTGAQVMAIGGTGAKEELRSLLPAVVGAAVAAERPTVVGDVFVDTQDGPGRAEAITADLSEEQLAAVALVDDVELREGQVATVLALDAAADGVVGHYGRGDGAEGILPTWTSP